MTEMIHGTVVHQPGEAILSRWWRTIDKVAIVCILMLFAIGLMLGFAASPPLAERNGLMPFHYVLRQAVFGSLALIVMLIVSMMDHVTLRRLSIIGFLVALMALAGLPLFGTDYGKGAVRWYSLGFASIQPSEFLKPVFVITTAWLIAGSLNADGPPGKMLSFMLTTLTVGLLIIQPDFGQAALIFAVWLTLYFIVGAPILIVTAVISIFCFLGLIAYQNSPHFASRIDGFINSEIDPNTQIGFATNAIREGGIFGAGVNEGTVKWSLPDAHTDFIIAVAAEEYGLAMVLVIVALFLVFTLRALLRLMEQSDPFVRLSGTGLTVLFGLQAIINLGVAVRLLPAKGMTLPFVSYGGSSILAMGLLAGCLLCCTRSFPKENISHVFRRP